MSLTLESVAFTYPGESRPVLNISITVTNPHTQTRDHPSPSLTVSFGEASVGQELRGSDGTAPLIPRAMLNSEVPMPELNSAVVLPGVVDIGVAVCWVRMQPASFEYGRELLRGKFAHSQAKVAPLIPRMEALSSAERQWRTASGLHTWAAAAVLLTAVGAFVAWSRRSESAVYRTFGTSHNQLWVMHAGAFALAILPAVPASFIVSVTTLNLIGGIEVTRPVVLVVALSAVSASLSAYGLTVLFLGSHMGATSLDSSKLVKSYGISAA